MVYRDQPQASFDGDEPSRTVRWGRYAAWTVTDQVIALGLPRLVLFPILGSMLGPEAFGSLLIALGFIYVVGLSPSNGLVGYIIRDLTRQGVDGQRLLLRSMLVMSSLAALPFGLFFIFGAGWIAGIYHGEDRLVELLPLLGAYLLLTNIVETSLTVHRVRRSFRYMVLVHAVQAVLLFLAIPLFHLYGVSGIALAYILSSAAGLILSLGIERVTYLAWPICSSTFVKAAWRVWPWFSLSAFIALSAGYLDRLLLGYWWSPADVAPFFAAVSTASLLGVPATQASSLILSLLGKVKSSDRFRRESYVLYAAGACGSALVVFAIGSLLGEFVLNILYPRYLQDALPLWNYVLGACALQNVRVLCRPFVAKFLSPKVLPFITAFGLFARLVPLIALVPSGGRLGAAQALLIGSTATALAWLIVFLRAFVFASSVHKVKLADEVTANESRAQQCTPAKPEKPTIAFLTHQWTNVDDNIRRGQAPGGVPSVSRIWTSCLDHGFDVHVFISTDLAEGWPNETVELGGVIFHWIRKPFRGVTKWLVDRKLIGLAKPLWLIWQVQMLRRIIDAGVKPDLVYCMRTTYLVVGWLWARMCGAKIVVREYGSWLHHVWFEQKRWLPRITLLGNLLAHRIPTDLQVMTNDGSQGDKAARWAGYPMDRFRFWLNGVDKTLCIPEFDKTQFKREIGIDPDASILLTLGRLSEWKRLDRAIDAMPTIRRHIPSAHLLIVGGGPLREQLEAHVRRLDLSDAATFVGPVPHEKIKEYLNAADVMIIAHDLTSLCNTLIEAVTAGCCVITRDVGSTTEIVTHDENAIVLNPGEADDIAQAAIHLLQAPSERERIGRTARRFAEERFQSWDERMTMEVQCLEGLIGIRRETG